MNREILNVVVEDDIDSEALETLEVALSSLKEDFDIHKIPPKDLQASLLLFGFTSVAVIFGGAFVKKLGDKAAEDSYPYIKQAISGIYHKYFGSNPLYQVRILTSSENKAPNTKYSLILALYCVGKNNEHVKFLYETNWTKEEFDKATGIYIEAMIDFVGSSSGVVNELIKSGSTMEPHLIAWDAGDSALVKIEAIPKQK